MPGPYSDTIYVSVRPPGPGHAVMLLDISRLRGDVEHVERRFEPSSFQVGKEEFRVTAPANMVADVRKDGRNVRLTGRVQGAIECDCSRCLEAFAIPVDAPLDLLFLPATEPVPGASPDGETAVEEDDLGDVVREQFYLALPMKPLCREDCRGLCPICGGNRNRVACTCQAEWVDPRLEALKALKLKK